MDYICDGMRFNCIDGFYWRDRSGGSRYSSRGGSDARDVYAGISYVIEFVVVELI